MFAKLVPGEDENVTDNLRIHGGSWVRADFGQPRKIPSTSAGGFRIVKPTISRVKRAHKQWAAMPRYVEAQRVLDDTFRKLKGNKTLDAVLPKVVLLNELYSTRIYDTFSAAHHILGVPDLDARLRRNDLSLVADIAPMYIGGKVRNNYSFASKYCAHHNGSFPIYDRFVDDQLWMSQMEFEFSDFRRYELKDYPRFYQVLTDYRSFFNLEQFTLRELDIYLWLLGKKK